MPAQSLADWQSLFARQLTAPSGRGGGSRSWFSRRYPAIAITPTSSGFLRGPPVNVCTGARRVLA